MNELSLIFRSINDFFSKPMLKIAFIPLFIVLICMYVLFFIAADFGFSALSEIMTQAQNGEEVFISADAPFYFVWLSSAIIFLFQYSITSWIVGFLFYTVGSLFILMFSVFITLIIVGFLTPLILKILHKKHYSHLRYYEHGNLSTILFVLIKTIFIMLFLFILFIPLYFIPLINIIAFNLPFYYLFHKLINFDVSSSMLKKEEYEVISAKSSGAFRVRTLFLYFISMIPFITLFTSVFYIIYIGNAYFLALEKLRKKEDSNNIGKNSLENQKRKITLN